MYWACLALEPILLLLLLLLLWSSSHAAFAYDLLRYGCHNKRCVCVWSIHLDDFYTSMDQAVYVQWWRTAFWYHCRGEDCRSPTNQTKMVTQNINRAQQQHPWTLPLTLHQHNDLRTTTTTWKYAQIPSSCEGDRGMDGWMDRKWWSRSWSPSLWSSSSWSSIPLVRPINHHPSIRPFVRSFNHLANARNSLITFILSNFRSDHHAIIIYVLREEEALLTFWRSLHATTKTWISSKVFISNLDQSSIH